MTNQQGAPEALRLAAEVLDWMPTSDTQRSLWYRHQEALAVVKAALVEAQQPANHVQKPAETEHVAGDVSKNRAESNMKQQPATDENLRQILTDSENQPNQYGVQFLMHGAKMAFRIGNRQFCLDYEPDEPGEFEFMRDALISAFSTFTPDVKMAQQPAPSAASKAVLAAIRAANMQLVRTGDDEFMLVTYKNAEAQCDGGQCGIGGYCDDCPTPQADSQPAPAAAFEVADAMADSQYLAGVSAGWNAANAGDPNAALQKLHESRAGYLKPLSAARAPADSVPPMTAADAQRYAEIEANSGASDFAAGIPQADSVTAPAYSIDADPQGIRARVADAITGALAFGAQGANPPPTGHWLVPFWETAREEASRNRPVSSDTLYLLRRLLSNQHTLTGAEFREELTKIVGEATQAADSVLEDAARLERERICAAIKAEDDYCVDQGNYMLDSDDCIKIVRGEWVRPDFAIDAARKQGGT